MRSGSGGGHITDGPDAKVSCVRSEHRHSELCHLQNHSPRKKVRSLQKVKLQKARSRQESVIAVSTSAYLLCICGTSHCSCPYPA